MGRSSEAEQPREAPEEAGGGGEDGQPRAHRSPSQPCLPRDAPGNSAKGTFTAGPPITMDITGWDFLALHSPHGAGEPQLQPQQGQGRGGAVTEGPRPTQWPWSGL